MFVGLIRGDCPDDFAVAENGDAAAGGQYLAQLMGDEDDGLALAHQAAQDVEQPGGLPAA